MKKSTKKKIKEIIYNKFKYKILNYSPETEYAPFQNSLLGQKYKSIYSFCHSVSTIVGMVMHEPIAKLIAEEEGGFTAEGQYPLRGAVDSKTETLINSMYEKLDSGSIKPNYKLDLAKIKKSTIKINSNKVNDDYPDRTVDLFLKKGNDEYYIDITSPKPNKKEFAHLKKKLFRWAALRYSMNKNVKVYPLLAFPYNPNHPDDYKRFSEMNRFDLKSNEIRIQDKFWNWLSGGKEVYEELILIYEESGSELKTLLESRVKSF